MKVREFLTTWGFDVDFSTLEKMDAKIGEIRNEAKGLGKNFSEISGNIRQVGSNLTTFVTAPITLLGGALVKSASDAEETFSKFDTVFKDVSKSADETAKNLSKSFGLSSVKAKQLLGDTGDLLSGFGFTGDMALELSKRTNELAVDLASFTNHAGGAEGASAALTKALLGERESIKSLGIAILEEDVKARVEQLKAAGKVQGMTERQIRAFATLELATEQSKNAVGDYARTADSFANRSRVLTSRIHDLSVSLGEVLLPFATKLVNKFTGLIEKFNNLSEDAKKWIVVAGGIAAVIGPTLIILGLLGQSLVGIASTFKLLSVVLTVAKAAFLKFNLAALLLPALIVGIIALVGLLAQDIWKFATDQPSLIGKIVDSWGEITTGGIFKTIGEWIDWLKEKFSGFAEFLSNFWNDLLSFPERLAEGFRKLFDAAKPITDLIGKVSSFVGGGVSNLFNKLTGEDKRQPTVPTRDRTFWEMVTGSRFTPTEIPSTVAAGSITNSTRSGNTNNINTTVNLEVPHGTTTEQTAFLEEQMERIAKETMSNEVNRTLNQIPEHD